MNKRLKKLSSELKSRGHNDASDSVNDLISKLSHIKKAEIDWGIKEDAVLSDAALQTIVDYFGLEHPNANPKIAEYQKLISCTDDIYCGLYRNEEFEQVAADIFAKIIDPLTAAKRDLVSAFGNIDEEDKEILSNLMTSDNTVTNQELQSIVQEARYYRSHNKNINKLASQEKYIKSLMPTLYKYSNVFDDKFYKYADEVTSVTGRGTGFSGWLNRLMVGDKAKAAARAAGQKAGFWQKALPFVGIAFSLPLMMKNLFESIENGKRILYELPLEKYGISKEAAFTPAGIPFLAGPISAALEANQENPENLLEILTIMKTISAFWLDVIFAVTNAIALVLDVAAILASFIDGPLPVADVLAGGFSILATLGLVGLEYGSEYAVGKFWEDKYETIKDTANEQINNLKFKYPEAIEEASEALLIPGLAIS